MSTRSLEECVTQLIEVEKESAIAPIQEEIIRQLDNITPSDWGAVEAIFRHLFLGSLPGASGKQDFREVRDRFLPLVPKLVELTGKQSSCVGGLLAVFYSDHKSEISEEAKNTLAPLLEVVSRRFNGMNIPPVEELVQYRNRARFQGTALMLHRLGALFGGGGGSAAKKRIPQVPQWAAQAQQPTDQGASPNTSSRRGVRAN